MGQNSSKNVRAHMETAQKTGALVLTDRGLTELPNLSAVSKVLRTLDISSNKLPILPTSVTSLCNLKHLTVNANRLSSLPVDLGHLIKLESLSLMHNNLTSLPESCSKLKNVKSLILSHNNFRNFPIEVCSLPHLDVLDLSHNKVHSIPDEIQHLQTTELNLNQNEVSHISPNVSRCPRLKTLRLEENSLELSAVPTELLTGSAVSLLCLAGNLFSEKQFQEYDGYSQYMERYTAVKKKMY